MNKIKHILLERNYKTSTSATHIVLPILFEFLLLLILFFKDKSLAYSYLFTLIPLLLLTALIGTYIYNNNGDMKLFSAITILTSLGIALQLLVDHVYAIGYSFNPLKHLVALLIALVLILIYILIRNIIQKPAMSFVFFLLSISIYVYLYLFGIDPNGNGTYAWIQIRNYTFQLTDLTKICAVLFYSSLFSSKTDETKTLVYSTAFFIVNFIGSVIIRELGSFFILYFLHLAMLFIFMEKGKKKRIYLLTIFSLTILSLATVYFLYRYLRPIADSGGLNSITNIIYPIAKKVYMRFSVTANIESDPLGAGYQLMQGRKILWISGLFGNTINFSALPVPESDMAFISLINGFGFIMGFFALLQFLRIMISGSEISRKLTYNHYSDAVVAYGFTILLFAQAILVILGSSNVIPLAGLPIPFLSRGGSYQAIVFMFSGILLYLSRNNAGYVESNGGTEDE